MVPVRRSLSIRRCIWRRRSSWAFKARNFTSKLSSFLQPGVPSPEGWQRGICRLCWSRLHKLFVPSPAWSSLPLSSINGSLCPPLQQGQDASSFGRGCEWLAESKVFRDLSVYCSLRVLQGKHLRCLSVMFTSPAQTLLYKPARMYCTPIAFSFFWHVTDGVRQAAATCTHT